MGVHWLTLWLRDCFAGHRSVANTLHLLLNISLTAKTDASDEMLTVSVIRSTILMSIRSRRCGHRPGADPAVSINRHLCQMHHLDERRKSTSIGVNVGMTCILVVLCLRLSVLHFKRGSAKYVEGKTPTMGICAEEVMLEGGEMNVSLALVYCCETFDRT